MFGELFNRMVGNITVKEENGLITITGFDLIVKDLKVLIEQLEELQHSLSSNKNKEELLIISIIPLVP